MLQTKNSNLSSKRRGVKSVSEKTVFTKSCVHVTYGCSVVLLWQLCDTLHTSGLLDGIIFPMSPMVQAILWTDSSSQPVLKCLAVLFMHAV